MKTLRSKTTWMTKVNIPGILFGLGVLALWQLLVGFKALNLKYLPTPIAIASSFDELVRSTPFTSNVRHTLRITLEGWALASAAGVLVAIAVGLNKLVWNWTMSTIEVLRALPAITMLPIAVVIFGLSSKTELVLVVYVAFWPVLVSTSRGLRSIHQELRDTGRTLRLSRMQVIRKIELPAAASPCIVGLRISLTLALVLAVVTEIIANPVGIGYQVAFEQQSLHPDLMFACIFTIGVMGILLNAVFMLAVRIGLPGIAGTMGASK